MIEVRINNGKAIPLRPVDVKTLQGEYPSIPDFEGELRRIAKATRNHQLRDRTAALMFIRNELSKLRDVIAARLAARRRPVPVAPPAPPLELPKVTYRPEQPKTTPKAAAAAPPDPHARSVPMIVELFRSMRSGAMQVMVQTSATSLDTYIPALSVALAQAIRDNEDELDEMLKAVLQHAIPVALKVAGYKVDSVQEQRVLISGHISPDEATRVGAAEL